MKKIDQAEINKIIILIQKKIFDKSENLINHLLKNNPDSSVLYNLKGVVYSEQNKNDQAIINYKKSIQIDSQYFNAYNNLGVIMFRLQKFHDAIKYFNEAIKINPKFCKAINSLGATLIFFEKFDEAINCFNKVLEIEPNNVEAYCNKGNILKNRGYSSEATICFEKALKIDPKNAKIHNDYAVTLKRKFNIRKAISHLKMAINLDPNYSSAYMNLGQIYKDLIQFDKSIKNYEKAINIKPDYDEAYTNLLYTLSFIDNCSHEYYNSISDKYRSHLKLVAKKNLTTFQFNSTPKKLKIGFVSGDFANHSVGHFLFDLIKNLNSSSLELYAYNTNNFFYDDLTNKFKKNFHFWRNIFNKNDSDICNIIRKDGIHILIDLAGLTAYNKLSIFVNKPAPIQATWLGCNISTGIPEIDYVIGDRFSFKEEHKKYFVEKIWHLPHSLQCLSKPDYALEKKEIPAIKNNFVTFGSFNNPSKLSDNLIRVWSEILKSIKNSKIYLKSNLLKEESVLDTVSSKFKENGIDQNKLIIKGFTKTRRETLLMYNEIDIALDTFPYNGATTSYEAVLMGVPVLTKQGLRPHSKIGESLNYNINMSDWIAKDDDNYIKKAINFSSDLKKLSLTKKKILKTIFNTSSFNTTRFAKEFEKEIWKMWNKYINIK